MLVAALSSLLVFARAASAIGWGIDLTSTNGNVWTSIQYTITVPPAPPPTVTTGPWYFWCGVEPGWAQGRPAVVQPVLQYRAWSPAYVNPNPSFGQTWAMQLWMVGNTEIGGSRQVAVSNGIWLAEGDKVVSTAAYSGGNWTQNSWVSSGKAAGLSVHQNEAASKLAFPTNSAGDSNAQFFICESEFYGDQWNQWAFDVTFNNIYITAKTSVGVQSACQNALKVKNDGQGVAIPSGFEMINSTTCHFRTLTLVPPGPCTSNA